MNRNLAAAKAAKQDEFYTQYVDIQKEVEAYLEFDPNTFKGKIVYCNCDDPFESNFFKFFAANFNKLGLTKLITTSYDGSPIAGLLPHQPRVITERENATLSGVLRDGTPFDFQLNTDFFPWLSNGSDLFPADSTVSVTLVPEAGGLRLASMAAVGGVLAFRSRRQSWSA